MNDWTLWDDFMATLSGGVILVGLGIFVLIMVNVFNSGWGLAAVLFIVAAFAVGRLVKWKLVS